MLGKTKNKLPRIKPTLIIKGKEFEEVNERKTKTSEECKKEEKPRKQVKKVRTIKPQTEVPWSIKKDP